MLTVHIDGRPARLDDAALLGAGGEGAVYAWQGQAVKIFHAPTPERARKVAAFPAGLPANVLGPTRVVEDAAGAPIGFVMPLAPRGVELFKLGQRRHREGTTSNGAVGALFEALRATLASLHGRGVVVGDLNDGNVLVSDGRPWLIDADSMQHGAFPCTVAHERTLDPRLFGVDLGRGPCFSPATDWYAFAVLLYTTWLYVHPYGGHHPGYKTLLRRAEARASVLAPEVKLPPTAAPLAILSDDLLAWFERVFEKDERAPIPPALLATRWTRCACGVEHARARCPECARARPVQTAHVCDGVRVRSVLAGRGRIAAAAMRGGRLTYLVEEDGRLRRDDGSDVPASACPPGARIVLAGPTTWIGVGPRLACVRGGRVVDERSCGTAGGEAAFDANATDAWMVADEWLVRVGTDKRVGRVLEGQTWLRVGERFGFGLYRVGRVTFPFLFSCEAAGLRHLSLPIPDGKIVDVDVAFDRDLAFVTMVVDGPARRVVATFALSQTGRVLGTRVGSPDDDPVAGAELRCAAYDALVCAGPGGLSVARADAQTAEIVERKTFSKARPWLDGAAAIFAGPGGSLYVVRNQEILELSLV